MKIRIAFGYICIALSLLCCAVQLITLPRAPLLPPDRLIILFLVAVMFAFGGLLSFESRRETDLRAIMVACFVVALGSLVAVAAFTIVGSPRLEAVKYALMLFYALLYACFGVALSFIVHRRFGGEGSNPTATR